MSADFDTVIDDVNRSVDAAAAPVASVVTAIPSSPVTDTVFTYGLGSAATRTCEHVKVAVAPTSNTPGVGVIPAHSVSVITGVYGTPPVFVTVIVYVNV